MEQQEPNFISRFADKSQICEILRQYLLNSSLLGRIEALSTKELEEHYERYKRWQIHNEEMEALPEDIRNEKKEEPEPVFSVEFQPNFCTFFNVVNVVIQQKGAPPEQVLPVLKLLNTKFYLATQILKVNAL